MRGSINLSGVSEGGTFGIQDGIYVVEITRTMDKITKNNDTMISVQFTIKGSFHNDNWIWDNVILSENTTSPGYKMLGKAKHFLRIIGEEYEGNNVIYDTENWIGKRLRIKVKKNEVVEHLLLSEEAKGEENGTEVQNNDGDVPF